MESEKKPRRPRIGSSSSYNSEFGAPESRYEKVNYPKDNYPSNRAIQASTPADNQENQHAPFPGRYQANSYQPRPNYSPNQNENSGESTNSENTNASTDQPLTPYQPSGSYHRQNYGDQQGYRPYNRQGGYNNQNRQGGYNNQGYNRNNQGGYNNQGYNRNNQGGYNNQGYNRNNQGGYNNQGYNRNNQGYNRNNQGGYNRNNQGYDNQGGYYQNRQGGYHQGGYNNQNRQGGYNNQGGYNRNNQGGYNRNNRGGFNPNRQGGMKFTPRPRQIDYVLEDIDPNDEIRLNKYMSNAGLCSRREADELITQGKVKVNGVVVTELGTKIKRNDVVECDDKVVTPERKCYVLLNKPKDCVTTSSDPKGRTTVLDIVKNACTERIYPVGRLDRNTTGVLLLTNDGDLASKLTHPKFVKKKIYHVWTDKDISEEDMQRIADGIELEDGEIHADAISYVNDTDRNQAGIEIHSGRNRIVRRIFESLGYRVVKLDRVYFAGLTKKNLPRGKWRYLTQEEVNYLRMGAFE